MHVLEETDLDSTRLSVAGRGPRCIRSRAWYGIGGSTPTHHQTPISISNMATEAAIQAAIQAFEYLAGYKVLVCKEHGYGLRNVKRHLLEHHSYHRHVRDAVVEHFGGLDIACPEEVALPTSASDVIEVLQAPRTGLRCNGWEEQTCDFVSTSKEKMSRHCNQHGWRSTPGSRTNWATAMVQSFCPASQSPRWFVVASADTDDTGDEGTGESPSVSQADRQNVLQVFRTMDDRHRRELEVVDAPVETDQTGWWKKTGWIEHLQGSNKRHLAHAARLPSKDEPVLKQIGSLVDLLVEQCVEGLSTLPQELRRWLRSVKMSETDQRPMARLQNKDSQARYSGYVKRLVCYSLRVLQSVDGLEVIDSNGEDEWVNVEAMDTTEEGHVEGQTGGPPDTMADARRLFGWNDGQKEKGRAVLRSMESGDEEAAQLSTLLAFVETFVFSKVYHEPFDCPTVHFLAVLGIDEENDRLRTGNDYSYRVAGLVYCFRVFALEALLPSERRATQGPDDFEAFLEQRKQYLTDGSMSVMSTMISLLAYGKYLAMNHGNAGAIFWEKEDKVMKLHGMRIVMDKVKSMVDRAIADAENLLWRRLLWTEDANRFEMDINALEDDMSFRKRGSYFVTNRQNRLMSSWEDKTVTWMLASRRGRKMRQEDGSWHTRRVREYLREVDKFRELLLFCMHVTGGQPARGPEILSLRYKNGFSQDRNIFVLDGLVMSVTRYHKTLSQWDVPKTVPRFMPWRVGQLVTVYLTYVQPLMERLSVAIGHGCGRSEYIWADANGPWDTTKLTKVMKQRSGEDLGFALGTMDYRHAAVGMGRRFVGVEFARGYHAENEEVDEPEVESDDPLEISAGRGSAIGVNRYAVPSDIVKHLSEKNIQTFRPLSESWHRFLGLESRKAGAGEGQTPPAKRSRTSVSDLMTPTPSDDVRPTSSRASIARMSTSSDCSITSVRSLSTGPVAPATPRTPRIPATPTTASTASTASSSSSRSWGTDSFCASPPLLQRCTDAPLSPCSPTNPPAASARFCRPSEEERSRAIRKALGRPKNAVVTYRSIEQEVALNRIMDDVDTTLVVVLPTGGGKTLLFTAPACLDDPGMIVVVIPYRRLMDDTVRNARALRIDCLEWTQRVEDPATIVFVSADRLCGRFFDYVARMRSKGLLRKIYVDECHLAVTAHSWRPKVVALSELRGIGVPLVMLTATAPVYMESDLESTMSSTVSTSWIRASTARRTTRYTVNDSITDGRLMEEAVRRCNNLVAQLKRRERMISYCRSRVECEELARKLGCGFFYAGNPDNPDVLKKWLSEGGMIVATTALGTGVSYPGVMLVVHVGLPYGLIDFSQESGRAGRGGEQVDSLVLLEQGWESGEEATRKRRRIMSSPDERAMAEFVKTRTCRRLVLAKHLDRAEPVDCETGDMARCDRCSSGITDRQRSESRTARERGVVTDALDQISGGCVVCWVAGARGAVRGWQHDGRGCRWREAVPIDDGGQLDVGEVACDSFRETIRYLDAGHACHRCGISQRLCGTRTEKGTCQWPHIAVPLARLALACGIGRNIIRKAGYEGERGDWGEYALWLGQAHRLRLWGELVSNSMVVMSEFLIYCAQERGSVEEVGHEEAGIGGVEGTGRGAEDGAVVPVATDAVAMDGPTEPCDEIEEVVGATPPSRRRARDMGSELDIEQIRRLVDGWKDVCVICKARGRASEDHAHWKECGSGPADKAAMEGALMRLGSVKFESFSGCDYCRRPQAVCELWARSTNAYGWTTFKKRQGVQCRYGSWLSEGVAALMAFGSKDWLGEERDGVAKADSFVKEMGRKHRRRDVEFNGMFMYFYRWAW